MPNSGGQSPGEGAYSVVDKKEQRVVYQWQTLMVFV